MAGSGGAVLVSPWTSDQESHSILSAYPRVALALQSLTHALRRRRAQDWRRGVRAVLAGSWTSRRVSLATRLPIGGVVDGKGALAETWALGLGQCGDDHDVTTPRTSASSQALVSLPTPSLVSYTHHGRRRRKVSDRPQAVQKVRPSHPHLARSVFKPGVRSQIEARSVKAPAFGRAEEDPQGEHTAPPRCHRPLHRNGRSSRRERTHRSAGRSTVTRALIPQIPTRWCLRYRPRALHPPRALRAL